MEFVKNLIFWEKSIGLGTHSQYVYTDLQTCMLWEGEAGEMINPDKQGKESWTVSWISGG